MPRGTRESSVRRPILVVDDTTAVREMIAAILAPRGYRVSAATNGRDGLSRLRAAVEPHLILLDVVMPLLDGIGFWRGLQADAELLAAGHRIILMSSAQRLASPDLPRMDGQLVKPFTAHQLIAAIHSLEDH